MRYEQIMKIFEVMMIWRSSAISLSRKDPLSFQNPGCHHVNINNNGLIPLHGVIVLFRLLGRDIFSISKIRKFDLE